MGVLRLDPSSLHRKKWGVANLDVMCLVVVLNIFYFHPYLGKIPILTNIFQLGGVWLNLPAWSPVPAERAVCYLGKCHGGRSTV